MTYQMRLHNEPFQLIKDGTKTIEMRLYDEKRRKLKIGDIIEFQNRADGDTVLAHIIQLHIFPNFATLYKNFDQVKLGYSNDQDANPDDMNQFYASDEQEKYGVVAIEIALVK